MFQVASNEATKEDSDSESSLSESESASEDSSSESVGDEEEVETKVEDGLTDMNRKCTRCKDSFL